MGGGERVKYYIVVKLLTYWSTLTYGRELWFWIQAAEMSFLQRVVGLSLRYRVRSSVI